VSLPYCGTSGTTNINGTDGQWGCTGAARGVNQEWVFAADYGRTIDWSLTGYQDSRITFFVDGQVQYGPFSPSSTNSYYFAKGLLVRVRYSAGDNTQSQYGCQLTVQTTPELNTLVSAQAFVLTKEQPGGFVYFGLPAQSLGKQLSLDVEVYSYQGLREPSVYVSRNRAPTLERFDYTNTTVSGGGRETCLLFIQDPPAAAYMVGVFLYGSAASMSVTANWIFNVQHLQSGIQISKSTAGTDYYQVFIPFNTPKMTFQISRQAPGGFPIAYIAQGSVPYSGNYQYIADTSKQSYISITVPNPNPTGSKSPNPGNYMFAIAASGGTSGYIVRVDW